MYLEHLRSPSASVSCEQICAGEAARRQSQLGSGGSGLLKVMLSTTEALGG